MPPPSALPLAGGGGRAPPLAAPRREPLTWDGTRPARMGLGARPRPDVGRPRNGRGWGRVQPRSAVQSSPARCGVRAGPAAPKAGWAMPGVWERDLELCPSPRPASVRRHLSASPRARGPSAPQFTSGTRRPLTAPRRPGSCWGTRSSCDLASRRAVLLQPPPVPKHLPVSLRHLPAPLRSDRLSTERPLAALSCPSGVLSAHSPLLFPWDWADGWEMDP